MTTEDMLEEICDTAYKAYKKNSGKCAEAVKLNRHEPVEIEGIVFNCWKEYTMYRMSQYIQEHLPFSDVKFIQDGNNSTVEFTCTDEEQQKFNQIMYSFIKSL